MLYDKAENGGQKDHHENDRGDLEYRSPIEDECFGDLIDVSEYVAPSSDYRVLRTLGQEGNDPRICDHKENEEDDCPLDDRGDLDGLAIDSYL